MHPTFNIALVGDGGVGKTTYVERLFGGDEFRKPYTPSVGAEVHTREYFSGMQHGDITFHIWDTAGQQKFSGVRENYYKNADAAIVMYDVTSLISYKNVKWWCDEIRAVKPDIPIVIVGNKCDVVGRGRKVQNGSYFQISAKSKTDIEKPLEHLTAILMA
jgi:GTP-binding nuclear protein Ran